VLSCTTNWHRILSGVASEFSRTKTIAKSEQGAASNNNPILKWNASQYIASSI